MTTYNQIAGHSVERLAALSDGVFAVAMTLLVLDLRAPAMEAVHSEHDLWLALEALTPRLVMCAMTFLTLGIFWVGQQTQINHLSRSERSLTWMHLFFLFAVSITPFSTMLLAGFMTYRLALLTYWLNILLLGGTLYWTWVCALGLGVVRADISPAVTRAIKKRIVVAQALYAFGALLCLVHTYASIGFIVLVQLNYALAPRLPGRRRPEPS
ncbi:MAG TPA: TMEM175 family protein [Bryobacteraceae bacterium]|nr:TMEM175 family protein [Bryobacteraceae bacterium]